jgi:hypothetical protein
LLDASDSGGVRVIRVQAAVGAAVGAAMDRGCVFCVYEAAWSGGLRGRGLRGQELRGQELRGQGLRGPYIVCC